MAHAESVLRRLLESVADQHGYRQPTVNVEAIPSDGANYTAALYEATVSERDKDELKLFAKVAMVGDKMRIRMNADWIFATERFVYTKLAKVFDEIQEKYKVPKETRFIFPKFFGCNPNLGEETIILENLTARGYGMYDRQKSLDWDHAAVAVKVLARFHALSFAYNRENQKEYETIVEKMKYRTPEVEDQNLVHETWSNMIESALQVVKPEYRERVMTFLSLRGSTEQFRKYNAPLGKPVLIHGDYRTSNLLFKKQDGKIQTMPVDFQTIRSGCPVNDLIYFIFMGTDEQFRKQYYQQLIDHYYKELTIALKRLDLEASIVYPEEDYYKDLQTMLPYGILIGIAILPVVTVDADSAPRADGDADINNFVVRPNDLFAERFSGIVNDCIRWNAI